MSDDDSTIVENQPHEPGSVGQRLREAREGREFSIDTVAQALALAPSMVIALEADDYGSLGAPVYVRGYIRKYAAYLELAPDELVAAYEEQSAPRDPELHGHLSPDLNRRRGKSWVTPVVMVVVLAVIVVAALWAWRYVRQQPQATHIPPVAAATAAGGNSEAGLAVALTPPANQKDNQKQAQAQRFPAVPASSQAPAAATTNVVSQTATIVPPALPGTGAMATAETDGSEAVESGEHKLVLYIHDTSWVEIMAADHTRLYYDLAPAGSTLDFSDRHGALTVFLGNAPGVDVVVNGEPYPIPDSSRSGNTARFHVTLSESNKKANQP